MFTGLVCRLQMAIITAIIVIVIHCWMLQFTYQFKNMQYNKYNYYALGFLHLQPSMGYFWSLTIFRITGMMLLPWKPLGINLHSQIG